MLGILMVPVTYSTDTSTIITCTDDTCHFTVIPGTYIVLRTPVTPQYRNWHFCCLYFGHLSLHNTDTATYIACTLNMCHFTVQTLAPTLLVLWTRVTSQYRHWHLHCLYFEHVSLHSTDTGTYIAYTENACHFTVQTVAPSFLVLRICITSQYKHLHHYCLYQGYMSLHSTSTDITISFCDIRNLNNSAQEFQMCLLYVIRALQFTREHLIQGNILLKM